MSQKLRNIAKSINDETNKGGNTKERVASGFYQVDEDLTELENQIKQAELDRDNNKGIFGTLSSLKAKYPKADNKKEWYAFVGTDNPRERYHVTADGGDWLATGDFQNVGGVEMADYAKLTRSDGHKVVYTKDGLVNMPDDVLTSSNIEKSVDGIVTIKKNTQYDAIPVVMDYKIKHGFNINTSNGVIEPNSRYDVAEEYIPVEGGMTYSMHGWGTVAMYREDKSYISNNFNAERLSKMHEDAAFVRLSNLAESTKSLPKPFIYKIVYKPEVDTATVVAGKNNITGSTKETYIPSVMDKNIPIANAYTSGDMAIQKQVTIHARDGFTDFIKVLPNTKYRVENNSGFEGRDQTLLMYDSNFGQCGASRGVAVSNGFTTTPNTSYVRFTMSGIAKNCRLVNMTNQSTEMFSISNLIVPAGNILHAPEIEIDHIHFGDSHSTGIDGYGGMRAHPWIAIIAAKLNLNLSNFAENGAKLVDDLPTQMAKIPAGFKGIFTMLMGTNDYIHYINNPSGLGDPDVSLSKEYSKLDPNIYYEAYRKYIIDLRDKHPDSQLICFENIYLEMYNKNLPQFISFKENMRKICRYESVPFVDLGSICWTKNSFDMADKLHPNVRGIHRMTLAGLQFMKPFIEAKRLLGWMP